MRLRINSFLYLILLFPLLVFGQSYTVNSGTGLIMTPTARLAKEGTIAVNISEYEPLNKLSIIASPFDWLEASIFYTDINVRRYSIGSKQSYKDKGFSFKLKLRNETKYLPSLAIGFEDIAGTSIFKSEYFVSSKKIGNFDFSLGIGFGDFGSRGNIKNFIRSGERSNWDFSTGGEVNYDDFFKGKSSLFGGIKYQILKSKISFKAEYDGNNYRNNYDLIPGFQKYIPESKINYGFEFDISKNFVLGINYIKGNEFTFNLVSKEIISRKRGYYPTTIKNKSNSKKNYTRLLKDLKSENILLQRADINKEEKTVRLEYTQALYFDNEDIVRTITDYVREELGLHKYTVFITPANGSFDLSTFKLNSYSQKGQVITTNEEEYEFVPKIKYPVYSFGISPQLISHVGSPSGFYFGGIDLNLSGIVEFPNMQIVSRYNLRAYDNFDDLNYNPNPTNLPQVRTNIQKYLKEGQRGFTELTVNFFRQFTNEHNFLATAGHLETMFSGFHFEYLYKPTNSIFALGIEKSSVKQRDFDISFDGFQPYKANVYHANLYLIEPKSRVRMHLSYGKYLAGDKGMTIDFSRVFRNGASIGAFFSLTNISKVDFGEGSFDKGVYFKYPINIFNSKKSSKSFSTFLYRPVTRDGAAKLNISRRLYDLTEGSQESELILKRNY